MQGLPYRTRCSNVVLAEQWLPAPSPPLLDVHVNWVLYLIEAVRDCRTASSQLFYFSSTSPSFPENHDLLKQILPTLPCQLLELNSGQEQLWGSNVGVLGEDDERE